MISGQHLAINNSYVTDGEKCFKGWDQAGFMRKSFSQNWSKVELWTQKCQIKNWATKYLTGAAHNIKLLNQNVLYHLLIELTRYVL